MARRADNLKRITPPNELRYSGLYTAEWLNPWHRVLRTFVVVQLR